MWEGPLCPDLVAAQRRLPHCLQPKHYGIDVPSSKWKLVKLSASPPSKNHALFLSSLSRGRRGFERVRRRSGRGTEQLFRLQQHQCRRACKGRTEGGAWTRPVGQLHFRAELLCRRRRSGTSKRSPAAMEPCSPFGAEGHDPFRSSCVPVRREFLPAFERAG